MWDGWFRFDLRVGLWPVQGCFRAQNGLVLEIKG